MNSSFTLARSCDVQFECNLTVNMNDIQSFDLNDFSFTNVSDNVFSDATFSFDLLFREFRFIFVYVLSRNSRLSISVKDYPVLKWVIFNKFDFEIKM